VPIIAGRASAAYGAGFSRVVTPGYAGPFGAYDSLATVTLSTSTASVVFSGIPSGYKHLQLRTFAQQAAGGGYAEIVLGGATFVRRHWIMGGGSGALTSSQDTTNAPGVFTTAYNNGASVFAASIVDILDYGSTTKNKVTRSLGGSDNNGSGGVYLMSGLYTSTSSVTSITLNAVSQNFTQNSRFALYGVK
jgi:hypothetical protein